MKLLLALFILSVSVRVLSAPMPVFNDKEIERDKSLIAQMKDRTREQKIKLLQERVLENRWGYWSSEFLEFAKQEGTYIGDTIAAIVAKDVPGPKSNTPPVLHRLEGLELGSDGCVLLFRQFFGPLTFVPGLTDMLRDPQEISNVAFFDGLEKVLASSQKSGVAFHLYAFESLLDLIRNRIAKLSSKELRELEARAKLTDLLVTIRKKGSEKHALVGQGQDIGFRKVLDGFNTLQSDLKESLAKK